MIIRSKVAVGQVHLSSAPANHQSLPIVPNPGPTQMGYDTPSRVTPISNLQIVKIEVRHEQSILNKPRAGTGDQAEFVPDVMQPVDAGD